MHRYLLEWIKRPCVSSAPPTPFPSEVVEAEVVEGGLKEFKEGESDTVLTECVGEVPEGGIVLEAEAALALTSPYTAIVTSLTTSGSSPEGGGRVKRTGDAAQHVCQVLSVKGEALAALIDLCPLFNSLSDLSSSQGISQLDRRRPSIRVQVLTTARGLKTMGVFYLFHAFFYLVKSLEHSGIQKKIDCKTLLCQEF